LRNAHRRTALCAHGDDGKVPAKWTGETAQAATADLSAATDGRRRLVLCRLEHSACRLAERKLSASCSENDATLIKYSEPPTLVPEHIIVAAAAAE
jgi:hypothetical protein